MNHPLKYLVSSAGLLVFFLLGCADIHEVTTSRYQKCKFLHFEKEFFQHQFFLVYELNSHDTILVISPKKDTVQSKTLSNGSNFVVSGYYFPMLERTSVRWDEQLAGPPVISHFVQGSTTIDWGTTFYWSSDSSEWYKNHLDAGSFYKSINIVGDMYAPPQ